MPTEDNVLKVLLTEYSTLREELKSKFINQLTIFGIIVSALTLSYSLVFEYWQARDVLLIIPIITISLGLRAQHSNYGVMLMGEYLEVIEEKLLEYFKKDDDNVWIGWQHYWRIRSIDKVVTINDAIPKYLIYFFIPVGIAVFDLCFYGITNSIFCFIPEHCNVLLAILYLEIFLFFLLIYIEKMDKVYLKGETKEEKEKCRNDKIEKEYNRLKTKN